MTIVPPRSVDWQILYGIKNQLQTGRVNNIKLTLKTKPGKFKKSKKSKLRQVVVYPTDMEELVDICTDVQKRSVVDMGTPCV